MLARRRPDIFQKRIDKLVRRAISVSSCIGSPVVIEAHCACDACGLPKPLRCEVDGVARTYHIESEPCTVH